MNENIEQLTNEIRILLTGNDHRPESVALRSAPVSECRGPAAGAAPRSRLLSTTKTSSPVGDRSACASGH